MTWEDLKDEPTEHLIEYMKCKVDANYVELAKAAYVAFNFRFRSDVESKARKIGKYWDFDNETCDQLVEMAFKKFYQYPFKFTKSKCKNLSFNECVKVYMYKIVQHLFADHYKEIFDPNPSPFDGTEQVIIEFPELESVEMDADVQNNYRDLQQKLSDVLNTLTPNHKIIYLTYKAYEKKGFKLPRILLNQLREVTGLKQNSIRVYKKEVFEKIEEYKKLNGEE